MSIPNIGDVVYYKDNKKDKYILIEMLKNWEDIGSTRYDRDYAVLPYDNYDPFSAFINEEDLIVIRVSDVNFPFTKVDEDIPFNVNKKVTVDYFIDKKKEKIVYE